MIMSIVCIVTLVVIFYRHRVDVYAWSQSRYDDLRILYITKEDLNKLDTTNMEETKEDYFIL